MACPCCRGWHAGLQSCGAAGVCARAQSRAGGGTLRRRRRGAARAVGGGLVRPGVARRADGYHQPGHDQEREPAAVASRQHALHVDTERAVVRQARPEAGGGRGGRGAGSRADRRNLGGTGGADQVGLRAVLLRRGQPENHPRSARSGDADGEGCAGSLCQRACRPAGCRARTSRADLHENRAGRAGQFQAASRGASECLVVAPVNHTACHPAKPAQHSRNGQPGPPCGTGKPHPRAQPGTVHGRGRDSCRRKKSRPRFQESLSGPRLGHLPDPVRQCGARVGRDGRAQYPAAAGGAPLAGARVRGDAGGGQGAPGGNRQPHPVRADREPFRP